MSGETRKTEFPSGSGEKLAAALELPSGRPRAYALFAHCFTCSKDIKAAREIARALRAKGFAVLRFDFTGLGGSEGDFANTNFSSNVEDLVAAADFLRREFEPPSLLIGHSLGGAAAIVAATQIAEIKGVVTIGAPAEAAHVAMQIRDKEDEIRAKGAAEVQLAGRPFTVKSQFLDDLANQKVLDAAKALKRPLLVMHGPLDQTVGVENATQIFVAAKHPKSFISLDDADHLLSDPADARYAANALAAWSERFLPEAGPDPLEVRRVDAEDGGSASLLPDKTFAVTAKAAGHEFTVDADKNDGGDGLGPNPTRLAEAALAACTVMTLRMYARRKKWPIDALTVSVRREPGEDAHLSRALVKTIEVKGDLDEAQRERMHEIAGRCPVHRMLVDGVSIRSELA
ncbi:MAG: bifunctional alpha/beta hydrolase/OsmC family protein [Pseudomonadota bacterium]